MDSKPRACDEFHLRLDGLANGELQEGELPPQLLIRGSVVWWVYRGTHAGMGEAWGEFGLKIKSAPQVQVGAPPGDIYLCDPGDHAGRWNEMLTILWAPRK